MRTDMQTRHTTSVIARRLVIGLLIFAMAIAGWSAGRFGWRMLVTFADSTGGAPPRISIRQDQHDFGTVAAGSVLSQTFRVRNDGGRRLILSHVANECGCLAVEPEIVISPGGTRRIIATLDTSGFRGPLAVPVRYQTNDPRQPLLTFRLLAHIGPVTLSLSPNGRPTSAREIARRPR